MSKIVDAFEGCVRKRIDPSRYDLIGRCLSRFDAVIKAEFADADSIIPLIKRKRESVAQRIKDLVGPAMMNADPESRSAYYLVDKGCRQLLVRVTNEFMEVCELRERFTGRSRRIGDSVFSKFAYTL